MSTHNSKTLLYDQLTSRFGQHAGLKDLLGRVRHRSLPVSVRGPKSSFLSYLIARMQRESRGPLLVIVPNESEVGPIRGDLELFGTHTMVLPSWGTGAYATPSENASVWGERMRALTELWNGGSSAVVAPLRAVSLLMPPPQHSMQFLTTVQKGQVKDPHELGRFLSEMGFWRVPRVSVHGEFAVRGEVVDVFLPGWDSAVRIVFDFDTVSEIREFDPSTQSSLRKLASVQIYPLREVLWDDETRAQLNELAQSAPEIRHRREEFAQELMNSTVGPYWAAAAFSNGNTILDYLDASVEVVWVDRQRITAGYEAYRKEFETVFAQEHFRRPLPRPDRVLADIDALIAAAGGRSVFFESLADAEDTAALRFACDPPRSFFGNVSYLKEELSSLVATGNKVIVLADTEAQEKRIAFLLRELDVTVAGGHVSGGFALPEQRLVLVQENEIFGRRKRAPASLKKVESSPIDTFVELDEGDFVVHVNYGIGVFRGITRLKAAGNERDYIELEYADQEVVFTPIEQVNLIQRYIGSGGQNPRLDRIGGKSWEKRKSSVKKNVEDLADRLITLYSRRKQVQGFAFPEDTEWQLEFESGFPYEETEDQLRCIAEIKQDMERPQPMDRLVCGDVGYGKTELALRAAFKAVMSGKQVAILAPTTILVEQHYENMVERFERFPIRIGMLSRFVPKKEQKRALAELASGDLDIIIGTHRVLQKDVVFSDVGLLVIDEEQRFGVKAKERLKELKTSVDTLTLTATPIPRTLHMSLLKIRDMSVLTTPPHNRHPIRTVISEFNEEETAAAIRREVERGGQVFSLLTSVETL